ncbi:MAG: type II secretion system F family protein [Jatrophihabitantaceae bacterium]
MTALAGALLGLIAAAGVLIAVRAAPPLRPIRLADRLAPYLGDVPPPSRLLARASATSTPFVVVRRLFGPVLAEATGLLDRLVGGGASVRRRLAGTGRHMSVEEFRMEQVVTGACGMAFGTLLIVVGGIAAGHVNVLLAIVAAAFGAVAGVLGRDWWLSRELARREHTMLAEFPVVADLLALAVVAGEAPPDALRRVCRLTGGELARELEMALDQAQAGKSLVGALTELADRTTLEPFSRFIQGLVVAVERGTPLAEVLRAQAADVREMSKRALLEAGGRSEITMLVPVVFLILPVTVLFALYPGLLTLTSLTH